MVAWKRVQLLSGAFPSTFVAPSVASSHPDLRGFVSAVGRRALESVHTL